MLDEMGYLFIQFLGYFIFSDDTFKLENGIRHMYSKLYRSILFPFYETFLRRRKTLSYLREYEGNQWLSEDEIMEIQLTKLHKLLEHAYIHVPYYKKRFDDIGASPSDIGSIEEFSQFPFLNKTDIQNFGDELIAYNYVDKNVCQNETSGSTGQPLIFYYPRESYERRNAIRMRSESMVGLQPGIRTAMLWGRYVSSSFLKSLKKSLYWKSQNIKHINAFQLDNDSLFRIIDKLNQFKPQYIISYVTPIFYLSRLALENQIPLHTPKGVIAAAEKLYPHQRDLIEECFHTKVYNRYGCCEFMNIAAECTNREGMHINADNLIVEFVKTENTIDSDDLYEIVVTDLHNYGMPFIRYRLGDMGRPLNRKCSCGRELPLMDIELGRVNDVILTPDGKCVPDHLFLYIFAETRGVTKYQIKQKTKDALLIKLVVNNLYSLEEEHEILEMASKVLGDKIRLNIEYLDDIPTEKTGKFKYTCSEIVK